MTTTEAPPTPEEMRAFCKAFSKEQWEKLCQHSEFIQAVSENLETAGQLAAKILSQ